MTQSNDRDLLSAALAGYQARLEEIDGRIADLRKRIGGKAPAPGKPAGPAAKSSRLSPEGRARIIAAARKRWAEARKAKEKRG